MGLIHSRARKQRDKAETALLKQQHRQNDNATRQARWEQHARQRAGDFFHTDADGTIVLAAHAQPVRLTPGEAEALAARLMAAARP